MKPEAVAAIQSAIDAYFRDCDLSRERMEGKNGLVTVRQTPYTLAGLAAATGIEKDRIRALTKPQCRTKLSASLRDALRRIERYTVEHALLGELQLSVAQMLLSDLGYGAKAIDSAPGDGIVVKLDDPEGWGE